MVGHGLGDDLRAHRVADEDDDGARGAVGQVEHVAAHVLRDDGRVLLDRHVARRAGRRAEAGQVDRVHGDPGSAPGRRSARRTGSNARADDPTPCTSTTATSGASAPDTCTTAVRSPTEQRTSAVPADAVDGADDAPERAR